MGPGSYPYNWRKEVHLKTLAAAAGCLQKPGKGLLTPESRIPAPPIPDSEGQVGAEGDERHG